LTIFANGFLCYHPSSRGQQVGDVIVHMQDDFFFSIGSSYAISKLVTGSYICNLSGSGSGVGKFVRSSFGSAQVMKQLVSGTVVKLPSGKFRFFKLGSFATFGKVAENVRSFEKRSLLLKAGQVRHLGSRPVVRGVAINPIDHPHGGGEGRTSGGRSSVSPWGILTKGKKTRKRKVFCLK
jgi:large subunit ribosomal protein L2